MGAAAAGPTFITAAVQRSITGDAIVGAGDGPTFLAALVRGGTLFTKPDRATRAAAATSANAVFARETAAAFAVLATAAAFGPAAIQRAISIEPI
jgi:hypothetical protein